MVSYSRRASVVDMAMTRAEASFLGQTQAWHAGGAGRDLDAVVHLFRGDTFNDERLDLFQHEDSESSVDVLIDTLQHLRDVVENLVKKAKVENMTTMEISRGSRRITYNYNYT